MNILWFSWKDLSHPQAGGAEILTDNLLSRLVKDHHQVILVTSSFAGAKSSERFHGYQIIRVGNRYSLYYQAYQYYRKRLQNSPDLIIEEVNTFPFFTQFYTKAKKALFFHQLAEKIWFYETPFPFNLIGYLMEKLYLRVLKQNQVITVSESTGNNLLQYGFSAEKIHLISEGNTLKTVSNLKIVKKYPKFTLLSLGTIRPMKRILDQLEAFHSAKRGIPELKLAIAGKLEGNFGKKVMNRIKKSPYASDIQFWGKVTEKEKSALTQKCHLLLITSVKEGWGLTVTEASSQGTPAIVYNVDGLRDSIINEQTGLICSKNTPQALAANIVKLYHDTNLYTHLQLHAWQQSKKYTFEKSYQEFKKILKQLG